MKTQARRNHTMLGKSGSRIELRGQRRLVLRVIMGGMSCRYSCAFDERQGLMRGRYLSCDKFGILSANTEAVSPLESFLSIPTADTPGTFQMQTLRDTYLTIKPSTSSKAAAVPEIRGDADAITFNTTFRIRMQARFKPKLKAEKAEKAREKISTKELEAAVGRKLDDGEVRKLKRARREGDYHEALLDIKVKNKHDKYS
jgi:protein FRG1